MVEDARAFDGGLILAVRAPNGFKSMIHRIVLDGIFWIARTGSPWRDLPGEFSWRSSVRRRCRRWTLAGLWEQRLEALNESGVGSDPLQKIDSTIVRTHQVASPA